MRGLLFLMCAFISAGTACDVGPPLFKCGNEGDKCQVNNSQGYWEAYSNCSATIVFYPNSEPELVSNVAWAVKQKLRIRAMSPLAHSRTPLMCPGEGNDGVIISTRNLNSKRSVDRAAATATVHAGVNMRQLQDAVAAAGVSFPTSTSWEGVSAAGAISTGAHGSSLYGKGSSIHDYVTGMRLVVPAPPAEGYAKVVQLTSDDEDLKAATLSLGSLGVISEVTFSLQPLFKRSVTLSLDDDAGLENRLVPFLNETEFALVYWYASHRKALMEANDRVPATVPGNGINKSSYQRTTVAEARENSDTYDEIEKEQDSERLCSLTMNSMQKRTLNGGGFLNDGKKFTGFPVVGFNHDMVNSGGCQSYDSTERDNYKSSVCLVDTITDVNETICSWDPRANPIRKWEFEFRVPISRAADAMRDIKKIREVSKVTRSALCDVEGSGFIMRTLKKSEAYLGPPEDAVTFEMSYYRSKHAFTPKWNMDVFSEIEQLLVEKYNAHLHWGKSGGYYFDDQAQQKTVDFAKFEQVRQRYDADGLFLNEWTEKIFGIGGKKVEELRDGCALEKLCKCSKDSHCAPSEGYFCRPGRVYTAARVCRKQDQSGSAPKSVKPATKGMGVAVSFLTLALAGPFLPR